MARKEIGSGNLFFGRQSHGGPFISPGGDGAIVYGIFAPGNADLRAFKAGADPLVDAWSEQDSGNRPTNDGSAHWCHQEGSLIHCVNCDELTTDKGRISYHVFNTGSDTWTTRDTVVSDPSGDPPIAGASCFIFIQTDGDKVVVGPGEQDKVKGTGFDRVDFWRDTGAGFGGANAIDDGGEIDYVTPTGLGVGNRVHAVYSQRADGAGTWTGSSKTIRDNDTLSSRTTLNNVPGNGGSFGIGVHYDDGGTERCRIPMRVITTLQTEVLEFDDADSPSITENTGVSDNAVFAADGADHSLSLDAKEVRLLYSDNVTQDIFTDTNDDDAGWGTDTEVEDGVLASRMWSRVIDRDGLKVAYTYRDGSTGQFYNEIDLGGAPPEFLHKKPIRQYLRM